MALILNMVIILIVLAVVCAIRRSVNVSRARALAAEEVSDFLMSRPFRPECDRSLLSATDTMDCILYLFQCWKDTHPRCNVIDYGMCDMYRAILLSRTINMYQDNKKLTSAEEHKLKELGILMAPSNISNKCAENVIRYDVSKLVERASGCVKYIDVDSEEDMVIRYSVERAFSVFKSNMRAIEKQEAAVHGQVFNLITDAAPPVLVKAQDETQYRKIYPVL
ncbi:hypothetical protein EMUR_03790 [Ehrlichia muris AS145]|uniref:Uncharacterized protein n=2 Tax=Ehrlichia muris TaxID=35795 RepID=V9R7E8_9RICK|nr:hypothetical protein EMUR_03790 [Ehrlichia muris AS145]